MGTFEVDIVKSFYAVSVLVCGVIKNELQTLLLLVKNKS